MRALLVLFACLLALPAWAGPGTVIGLQTRPEMVRTYVRLDPAMADAMLQGVGAAPAFYDRDTEVFDIPRPFVLALGSKGQRKFWEIDYVDESFELIYLGDKEPRNLTPDLGEVVRVWGFEGPGRGTLKGVPYNPVLVELEQGFAYIEAQLVVVSEFQDIDGSTQRIREWRYLATVFRKTALVEDGVLDGYAVRLVPDRTSGAVMVLPVLPDGSLDVSRDGFSLKFVVGIDGQRGFLGVADANLRLGAMANRVIVADGPTYRARLRDLPQPDRSDLPEPGSPVDPLLSSRRGPADPWGAGVLVHSYAGIRIDIQNNFDTEAAWSGLDVDGFVGPGVLGVSVDLERFLVRGMGRFGHQRDTGFNSFGLEVGKDMGKLAVAGVGRTIRQGRTFEVGTYARLGIPALENSTSIGYRLYAGGGFALTPGLMYRFRWFLTGPNQGQIDIIVGVGVKGAWNTNAFF